jgi:DNA-binding NarL/FixJ family response regulator
VIRDSKPSLSARMFSLPLFRAQGRVRGVKCLEHRENGTMDLPMPTASTLRYEPCISKKLQRNDSMNPSKKSQKQLIRIAVVDNEILRFVGFHALLKSEQDFELIYASLSDFDRLDRIDVILLGNRQNEDPFHDVAKLKASYPALQIIVVGSGMREETILEALASGAKGYVDQAASATDVVRAVRVVRGGSVWVSRVVLSMFVEYATLGAGRAFSDRSVIFTPREREVLEILVKGRSNREIGRPLGIKVRTVKSHVAKLMRKLGVRNRIALSAYAITHSLV